MMMAAGAESPSVATQSAKTTSSKKLDNMETTIKKMKLLWVKLEMNMFELV